MIMAKKYAAMVTVERKVSVNAYTMWFRSIDDVKDFLAMMKRVLTISDYNISRSASGGYIADGPEAGITNDSIIIDLIESK